MRPKDSSSCIVCSIHRSILELSSHPLSHQVRTCTKDNVLVRPTISKDSIFSEEYGLLTIYAIIIVTWYVRYIHVHLVTWPSMLTLED